jgi:hypothetical protein
MIIRMLILHVEEKLVEPMLAVARDEHMAALPTVNEPPPEEDGSVGGDERGERGGRGRRPVAAEAGAKEQ